MDFKEAMDLIEQNIGPETAATLNAGIEGDKTAWGYDSQLIIDMGYAVEGWVERRTQKAA